MFELATPPLPAAISGLDRADGGFGDDLAARKAMVNVTIILVTEVTMATWAVAEAKAKFSDVVEQAQHQGPQQITKNGRPIAVVVSMDEWKSGCGMTTRKGSFSDFFYNSPLRNSGIRLGRVRLEPRPVEF